MLNSDSNKKNNNKKIKILPYFNIFMLNQKLTFQTFRQHCNNSIFCSWFIFNFNFPFGKNT